MAGASRRGAVVFVQPGYLIDTVLYDADFDCKHEITDGNFMSGIKCKNCTGWFCF